jgi:hypothetical protein
MDILKQQTSRRQSETEPLNQKVSRDHGGDETDSAPSVGVRIRSLLPVPLRQCLSGEQAKYKGAIMEDIGSSSTCTSSTPSLPPDVPASRATKTLSDCSVAAPSDIDFSNSTVSTSGNGGGECYTSVSSMTSENPESEYDFETSDKGYSFLMFRLSYLFVTLVVMLADGLQGEKIVVGSRRDYQLESLCKTLETQLLFLFLYAP